MDKYNFGNKLTEYRIQKGLTQEELGKILGVSNKAVSKWENGSAMPRLDMMVKITSFFGVSIDEFIDNNAKSKSEQEMEQKYNKLYNEKMKKNRIIRFLLLIILPLYLLINILIYVFGPPVIVKLKYRELPDYAKMKPVEFAGYNMNFDKPETEVKMAGFSLTFPEGTALNDSFSNAEEYEKYYKYSESETTESDTEKLDFYQLVYTYDKDLEHYFYFLNKDNWFLNNYGRNAESMYDLTWLYYNYDFSDIKLCDWKKAEISYTLLTLWNVTAPLCDQIILYERNDVKGFITVINREPKIYQAELYNKTGEMLTITFCDKNPNDSSDYETFCKVINSVKYTNSQ